MLFRLRLAALFGLVCATAVPAETVGRFGVSAWLPGGYSLQPPPGNDDGRSFTYADGAEIRLWGSWPMQALAAEREQTRGFYRESGARLTYDAAGRDWFVLSGYIGGDIFYLRVEEGRGCDGDTALAHVELRYPERLRDSYDPLVTRVAGSLGFGPC